MKQPTRWKQVKRHPESAEYEDIAGDEWNDYVENMRQFGIQNGRCVMVFDGKIVDGWQMHRACVETNTKPTFKQVKLKPGQTIKEWVATVNDRRRHETPERLKARAEARRKRVAEARFEGQSLNTIAEKEGISNAQVRRDLEASGAPGGAPDEVKGKDGKAYSGMQPRIIAELQQMIDDGKVSPKLVPDIAQLNRDQQGVMLDRIMTFKEDPRKALHAAQSPDTGEGKRAPRGPKNGRILYDRKPAISAWGALMRQIDVAGNAYGTKRSPEAEELRGLLDTFRNKFEEWLKESSTKGAKAS